MYDLLIKNGVIIDGTGEDAYRADVAVKDGIICAIGELHNDKGSEVVNAAGKYVVPGFIDAHSHADLTAARFPDMENLTAQGVTTVFTGNCGMGTAPIPNYYMGIAEDSEALERISPPMLDEMNPQTDTVITEVEVMRKSYADAYGVEMDWSSWKEYTDHLERVGIGPNMMGFVGHSMLRIQIMGRDYHRPATEEEINQLCVLLHKCMEDGANGLSYGFDYVTGNYAEEEELLRLASVVAEFDGILSAHVQYSGRRGGKNVPNFQPYDGYHEFLEIGRKTGVRLQVSHLRTAFKPLGSLEASNAGAKVVMELIDEYRAMGVRVNWDVLPDYVEAGTCAPMLASLLQPYVEQCGSLTRFGAMLHEPDYARRLGEELQSGHHLTGVPGVGIDMRGWDHLYVIVQCTKKGYVGRSILQLAQEKGLSSIDMLLDILKTDVHTCAKFEMKGRYIGYEYYVHHPEASMGLDVSCWNYEDCNKETRPDMPPVYRGSLGDFAGMIYLIKRCSGIRKETLIASMTGRSAINMGLQDRGFIKKGMCADILILDWDKLDDNADHIHPNRAPKGVECVWVNGKLTVRQGVLLNPRAGRIIRNKDRVHE